MENGAGPAGLGSIGASLELGFGTWPIREAVATDVVPRRRRRPHARGARRRHRRVPRRSRTRARPTTLPGEGDADAWKAQPPYDWRPLADGKGVGFATRRSTRTWPSSGAPELDLRVSASAGDTDLQVTLSEIRPDGAETYVQNGWLRASHRNGDAPRSRTQADPGGHDGHRGRAAFPVAHVFRAGSRIRVRVEAPGGDRPRWRFDPLKTAPRA